MQTLNLEIRDQLFDMYVNKKLSTYEIARKLIKTERTICRWINVYGIPKFEKDKREYPVLKNKHWLIEMYVKQKKSAKEIGRMIQVSDERIRTALIEHGIPRRRREKKTVGKKKDMRKQQSVLLNAHQHGTWNALL
jgi:hypothetical protein